MPHILGFLWEHWVLVLEGAGATARLSRLALPVAPSARPFAATLAGASLLLLLYAALASGPDLRVHAFRAGTLLAALAAPLGALRVPPPARPAWGGGLLVVVALAGLLHAALRRRRRAGRAERALDAARLACEAVGLALFLFGAARLASGRAVSLRTAFWSLFLLRLSVADLLRPATLVFESGLPGDALADMKRAAGGSRGRRRTPASARLAHAAAGTVKGVLTLLWLTLPLLAAMAPAAVARGLWDRRALVLVHYPPLAIGATAAVLLVRSVRLLPSAPLRGARGGVVALASLLYLLHTARDPAFAAYRRHLPDIVLAEALFGLLLGAASRRAR